MPFRRPSRRTIRPRFETGPYFRYLPPVPQTRPAVPGLFRARVKLRHPARCPSAQPTAAWTPRSPGWPGYAFRPGTWRSSGREPGCPAPRGVRTLPGRLRRPARTRCRRFSRRWPDRREAGEAARARCLSAPRGLPPNWTCRFPGRPALHRLLHECTGRPFWMDSVMAGIAGHNRPATPVRNYARPAKGRHPECARSARART